MVELTSGFFNAIDGDRAYNAEDFSLFFKDFVKNGCFPNDTGLLAVPNPEPLGGNPPSVVIKPGKAIHDGNWGIVQSDLIFELNDTPGDFHLVYLCFDKSDAGRVVRLECATGDNPSLPPDADGKYYIPLARVASAVGEQPTTIDDLRPYAGVSGVGIDTPSFVQRCVTSLVIGLEQVIFENLGKKAVRAYNIDDAAIGNPQLGPLAVEQDNVAENAIGLKELKDQLVLPSMYVGAETAFDESNDEITGSNERISYTAETNGRMKVDAYAVIDGGTVYAGNPKVDTSKYMADMLVYEVVSVQLRYRSKDKDNGTWSGWNEFAWARKSLLNGQWDTLSMTGAFDMAAGKIYEVGVFGSTQDESVTAYRARLTATVGPR